MNCNRRNREWGTVPKRFTVAFGIAWVVGRTVCAGAEDLRVELRERASWKIDSGLGAVAFTPDSKTLYASAGDADSIIRRSQLGVIDLANGGLRKIKLSKPFDTVVVSHDGKRLAVAGFEQSAAVVDASDGKVLQRLKEGKLAHRREVIAFLPGADKGQVLTLEFGSVAVWDAQSGKRSDPLKDTKVKWDHAIVATPDGTRVATGADDGTLTVWDSATWQAVSRVEGLGAGWIVAISPDAKLAYHNAMGDRDGRILDLVKGGAPVGLQAARESAECAVFTASGRAVVVGTRSGGVSVYESSTGRLLAREHPFPELPRNPAENAVSALSVSPDGAYLAAGAFDGRVAVWKIVELDGDGNADAKR